MVENIQNQLKPVKSNQSVTVVQPEPSKGIEEKPKETEKPIQTVRAQRTRKPLLKKKSQRSKMSMKQKPSNPPKAGTRQRIQTGES
jgi:hypothetical protein